MTSEQRLSSPAPADAPERYHMVVGGRLVDAAEGSTFDVLNPATTSVIARVPRATPEDVDRAVKAARQAFEGEWSSWSATRRGRAMEAYAGVIREHQEELAQLESANGGKPITGARWEIDTVARVLEYYAGAANKLVGETIPVSRPGFDFTLREPVGVVGLIVPWNFPAMLASWKLGPALAAGNTVILKPASYTPLTAIRLGELALEAGIPAGVLNVVTGPGPSVGAAIAGHPGVDKVALTGETSTGQEVMRLAAGNIKKVSLELGGKSPNIVFADADLWRAAAESPYAVFDNCGQDCCARSRIFVERSIHEEFVERFAAATQRVRVGDPNDPASEVGSLISLRQRDRVEEFIRAGLEEGAHLVVGGTRPEGPPFDRGAFLLPTVFDHVTGDMRIVREEIFGPVVSIVPFETEEEAIRLANASQFGLSGSIWTRDIARALRVAKGVRAGVLSVNCNNSVHVEAPFGGYKMSGIGRELGMHALDEYTEVKNVFVDLG